MEKISVAVRFHPRNPAAADPSPAVTGVGGDREWHIDDTLHHRAAGPAPDAPFIFDHLFDGTVTNERVYSTIFRDLIGAVVDRFNATAFAYRQTSSVKTFTMALMPTPASTRLPSATFLTACIR
ncbi:unnamed protein product [Urochloa humidicola]